MKNRFSNNDDNDDDDMDEDMEEYFDMDDLNSSVFTDAAHIELVSREQDQNILKLAVELTSKMWFFKFYSLNTKLDLIEKTYSRFIKMLDKEDI